MRRAVTWISLLAILCILSATFWEYFTWRENRFDKQILAASKRYAVDPALVKAVIWKESRFNKEATGKVGETGLMQLREAAVKEWSTAERLPSVSTGALYHPGTNVFAGTWYLGKLLKRYRQTDNPIPYALADYNAGRTRVLEWLQGEGITNSLAFLNQITFPGTRNYIQAIQQQHDHYRSQFPLNQPSSP